MVIKMGLQLVRMKSSYVSNGDHPFILAVISDVMVMSVELPKSNPGH